MVYLYVGQFLPKDRTAKALAELFGTPMSAGTVAAMTARAAAGLDDFTAGVRARLAEAEMAHFDETALRVAGKLHWVHSASTGKYVLITVHERRGVEAMDAAGVLPAFTGIAVHDGWAPYDTYTQATHARCNAHLLRELQNLLSRAVWDEQRVLSETSAWAIEHLDDGDAVLIVDETGDRKSSTDCVGAARQYSGTLGKVALCQVTVNLTFATRRGHTIIDRALYLPAAWTFDSNDANWQGYPTTSSSRPSPSRPPSC
ncbi:hypothetical protein DMB38_25910 [Streptomyces sp. WAC 06738]|nr:hypothetical protein DMB38_25910 [Streptomyces sp. WAC 06738]